MEKRERDEKRKKMDESQQNTHEWKKTQAKKWKPIQSKWNNNWKYIQYPCLDVNVFVYKMQKRHWKAPDRLEKKS